MNEIRGFVLSPKLIDGRRVLGGIGDNNRCVSDGVTVLLPLVIPFGIETSGSDARRWWWVFFSFTVPFLPTVKLADFERSESAADEILSNDWWPGRWRNDSEWDLLREVRGVVSGELEDDSELFRLTVELDSFNSSTCDCSISLRVSAGVDCTKVRKGLDGGLAGPVL